MSVVASLIKTLRPAGKRWLCAAALVGLSSILAAAGCSHLAHKERELTFRIASGTASWYSGLPDGVEESVLPITKNGKTENVHTWWWPADNPGAPALLYLHGSRWNLTGQVSRIRQLRDFGFSVLAIDYRGFGKSDGGLPSEETVYEDARLAWEKLTQLQPDPKRRYIYGHSLGGAVAINLAASLSDAPREIDAASDAAPAHGLIVESSFTSLADVAKSLTYPWLPLQLILSQKFNSIEKISQVTIPVLLVHGTRDDYVPARFSRMLFDAAAQRKKLLMVDGANHNNSMRMGESAYREAFTALFGWAPGAS